MVRLVNMNQNSATNFNMVEMDRIDLYFSYGTVVAFRTMNTGMVISENVWGTTTGKHLNWIDTNKDIRIEHTKFVELLDSTLKGMGM